MSITTYPVPPYSTSATTGSGYYTLGGSGSGGTAIATVSVAHGQLQVNGDAVFDGKVMISGKNICDTLTRIEERLCIIAPNIELESRWAELKLLREQYVELERELLSKEKVMEILKR